MGVMNMRYRILIEQDEDGIFVAECPSLPGCISQGKTKKKILENIQDAIREYLAAVEEMNRNQETHQVEVTI
mgnify:CR=1 FL=1